MPCPLDAAHLAARFTSRTRQTGGTHGAGGAAVTGGAGSSLLSRFTLNEGKTGDRAH